MYINITCTGQLGMGGCVRVYITRRVGEGNQVMPKYFSLPHHFTRRRLGDACGRTCARHRLRNIRRSFRARASCMHVCKALEDANYNYQRFDALTHRIYVHSHAKVVERLHLPRSFAEIYT